MVSALIHRVWTAAAPPPCLCVCVGNADCGDGADHLCVCADSGVDLCEKGSTAERGEGVHGDSDDSERCLSPHVRGASGVWARNLCDVCVCLLLLHMFI